MVLQYDVKGATRTSQKMDAIAATTSAADADAAAAGATGVNTGNCLCRAASSAKTARGLFLG